MQVRTLFKEERATQESAFGNNDNAAAVRSGFIYNGLQKLCLDEGTVVGDVIVGNAVLLA